jgi:hypothetical protein
MPHGAWVMAMEVVLRRMGVANDVTVHGFRSSFRDWAGNETRYPHELAEHAVAHSIGDKVEQATAGTRRDAARHGRLDLPLRADKRRQQGHSPAEENLAGTRSARIGRLSDKPRRILGFLTSL